MAHSMNLAALHRVMNSRSPKRINGLIVLEPQSVFHFDTRVNDRRGVGSSARSVFKFLAFVAYFTVATFLFSGTIYGKGNLSHVFKTHNLLKILPQIARKVKCDNFKDAGVD